MTRQLYKTFLCQFAQDNFNFRLKEFEAITKCMGCNIKYKESDYPTKRPYFLFNAKIEDVLKILQRSVIIKFIYELWGHGTSYSDLKQSLLQIPDHLMDEYSGSDYTFSVRVKAYNKKVSMANQKDKIEWLSFLPFNGKVSLSNPQHEFGILEDYGDDQNNAPNEPVNVYFGQLIGPAQRHLLDQYSLKTRYFIGTTSMDPQLSFIMANMGNVLPNHLVFDPFAGTGSILVSCAHFGCYVMGGEIDWPLVHGRGKVSRAYSSHRYRGKEDNVRACLAQYGLEDRYMDMLVTDASRSVWREVELFDAIITDPPYGVREGSRKVGYRKQNPNGGIPEEIPPDEPHYSTKCSYHSHDVFTDLVQFAAKHLVTGGHLVYWIPAIKNEYDESLLPVHPCLELVSSCEQPLSSAISRYLVTMCKTNQWTQEAIDNTERRPAPTTMFDNFREKYFTVTQLNSTT